jgi:hypothetical protein
VPRIVAIDEKYAQTAARAANCETDREETLSQPARSKYFSDARPSDNSFFRIEKDSVLFSRLKKLFHRFR